MSLDPQLLAILADPEDKGPLYYVESRSLLYNPRLGRTYSIDDGIPNMLIENATTLDVAAKDQLDALVAELGLRPTFE